MTTIKTALIRQYRNGEAIQFTDDILSLTENRKPIHPKLESRYQELKTAYTVASDAFEPSKKLINTQELIAIDKERDETTIGLRITLVGLTKHPDPAFRKAATLVLKRLDSYGKRIYRFNFQLQTRITKDFIKALKDDPSLNTAIDMLLVIRAFIDTLEHTNTLFGEKYLDRTKEKGQKVEAEMETLIKNIEVTYRRFIDRLRAIEEMDDEGLLDMNLIRDINASIDQYNQVVIDRSGKTTDPDPDSEEDIEEELAAE